MKARKESKTMLTENREKRKYKRVPSNFKVRFTCLHTDYKGTVTNISEDGMFIKTGKMSFPFDSTLEIILHLKNKIFKVTVEVRRMSKSSDHYDGLGVRLLHTSQEYRDLVNTYKMIHQNRTAFTLT
ncbi:MAG: PilZ domain-containing protein [Nitrospiraceae bacterium]|nr:MAG: PilZ domain-containing protein [Nitrospiraceae bacterium]